ncbi:MAG: hypothetical protein AMS17_13090 [Spirochaetes bacterium DG_61]|nr:MAG: hypothetical protein AMS17_13090 [Spirochaetes bacterium DG_61]
MTRNTFLKFLFLSLSNVRRLVFLNLIFLPPLILFIYCFVHLIPLAVRYIDSMNISVLYVHPDYKKLAIVVIGSDRVVVNHLVYVFERRDLNRLRKHLFTSELNESSTLILSENALAVGEIQYPGQQLTLLGKGGEQVVTIRIEDVKEGSIEILFYNSRIPQADRMAVLYLVGLIASFLFIAGPLVGISDYTQRVVFHESKGFSYLFDSIRSSFGKSVIICLFFSVIIGAIVMNIYFYIFIMSTDISVFIAAINFWMLVFFLFILIWVYPISAMSRDESLWKVMKKSLFISFDNFDFTLRVLLLLCVMVVISVVTLFLMPGIAGIFSFLNTALKDLSSRYSSQENESTS